MAYNPYLNNPYLQPYMMPQAQQPVTQPVPPMNNIIWVSGESEARTYPVAPGNTLILMDNDNPVAYKKTADMSGRILPIEVYDLVRRDTAKEEPHQINLEEYLTRKEFESFTESIEQRFSEFEVEEEEVVIQPKRKVKRSESV